MNDDTEIASTIFDRFPEFQYPGATLWPVHPGRTLANELAARGWSANAVALCLHVPANRLTEIMRGERSISAETALRLGRVLGTGAEFWADLQKQYELAVAEREFGEQIAREVPDSGDAAKIIAAATAPLWSRLKAALNPGDRVSAQEVAERFDRSVGQARSVLHWMANGQEPPTMRKLSGFPIRWERI